MITPVCFSSLFLTLSQFPHAGLHAIFSQFLAIVQAVSLSWITLSCPHLPIECLAYTSQLSLFSGAHSDCSVRSPFYVNLWNLLFVSKELLNPLYGRHLSLQLECQHLCAGHEFCSLWVLSAWQFPGSEKLPMHFVT